MPSVVELGRAGEWWEHKLAPLLGAAYATAVYADVPLLDVADTLVLVLLALVPGAVYVSVLNDLTDLDVDRRAGKPNRLAGRPRALGRAAVAATVAAGAAIGCAAWLDDPLTLGLYAGAWVAFGLYSVPPARLKARGAAGALADAAGAHVFPYLFVAAAVLDASGHEITPAWLGVMGAWAAGVGVRGALLHQFGDVASDTRAGVPTFAAARPRLARVVGHYVAFPVELAALCGIVVLAGGWLAAALLVVYAIRERRRSRRWRSDLVVVVPTERYRVAMHGYYLSALPLAFLATAAVSHPADLLVLGIHVLLFPGTIIRLVKDSA